MFVTRGWSDDHGWSDSELAEALASGRVVAIEPLPEKTRLGWMKAFAAALEEGWAKDALLAALAGEAPLRAFEGALGRYPAERLSWLACRVARVEAVLRAWLEANDIEPGAPEPEPPLPEDPLLAVLDEPPALAGEPATAVSEPQGATGESSPVSAREPLERMEG